MSGHEIVKCGCGAIVLQCRCPGPHSVRVKANACDRCKYVAPNPPPVYDHVFADGVKWLDEDGA